MIPGSIGMILGIAGLILAVSGWGRNVCEEFHIKPQSIKWIIAVYVLGYPVMIPGLLKEQMSFSGFFLPLLLTVWVVVLVDRWYKKILIPVRSVCILAVVLIFNRWILHGSEVLTAKLIWSSACLILLTSLILAGSWKERFAAAWSASIVIQLVDDIWIRNVPFEYLEFGNSAEKDIVAFATFSLAFLYMLSTMAVRFRYRKRKPIAIAKTRHILHEQEDTDGCRRVL
ncbi:hypothetical protein LSG31_17950 [Fodinisporobacter ferrooxydans]|uniref:Lycopene cyclase domain-containing protein n=1 Tax=Fodinisporobacter ferrooxydans TaxID=2901836 RepID=A0ABY4CGU8_9BACL|nr:hypothetical protein LSG31_17950 [Alicyclobacillaceae bacterium MYW30-H2]